LGISKGHERSLFRGTLGPRLLGELLQMSGRGQMRSIGRSKWG
jgi:hypothetical protein